MEHYNFVENHSSYPRGFEQSLFNLPEHRNLQSATGWKSFYAINEKYKRIDAEIHFNILEGTALSPFRSPFGSLTWTTDIDIQILYRFISYCENELRKQSVHKLMIKNAPDFFYGDQAALLNTFFINLGYTIHEAEVGAVLKIGQDSFASSLSTWERRKLRQSQEVLTFHECSTDDLMQVYNFIAKCRQEKSYMLSMSLEQLQSTISVFRDRFKLFIVKHGDDMAAASISLRVKSNIIYNFYADHDAKFDDLSPIVKLMEGLYDHCFREHVTMLDLGTSAINGTPNFGLLKFKLNLGAIPSSKLTFTKELI